MANEHEYDVPKQAPDPPEERETNAAAPDASPTVTVHAPATARFLEAFDLRVEVTGAAGPEGSSGGSSKRLGRVFAELGLDPGLVVDDPGDFERRDGRLRARVRGGEAKATLRARARKPGVQALIARLVGDDEATIYDAPASSIPVPAPSAQWSVEGVRRDADGNEEPTAPEEGLRAASPATGHPGDALDVGVALDGVDAEGLATADQEIALTPEKPSIAAPGVALDGAQGVDARFELVGPGRLSTAATWRVASEEVLPEAAREPLDVPVVAQAADRVEVSEREAIMFEQHAERIVISIQRALEGAVQLEAQLDQFMHDYGDVQSRQKALERAFALRDEQANQHDEFKRFANILTTAISLASLPSTGAAVVAKVAAGSMDMATVKGAGKLLSGAQTIDGMRSDEDGAPDVDHALDEHSRAVADLSRGTAEGLLMMQATSVHRDLADTRNGLGWLQRMSRTLVLDGKKLPQHTIDAIDRYADAFATVSPGVLPIVERTQAVWRAFEATESTALQKETAPRNLVDLVSLWKRARPEWFEVLTVHKTEYAKRIDFTGEISLELVATPLMQTPTYRFGHAYEMTNNQDAVDAKLSIAGDLRPVIAATLAEHGVEPHYDDWALYQLEMDTALALQEMGVRSDPNNVEPVVELAVQGKVQKTLEKNVARQKATDWETADEFLEFAGVHLTHDRVFRVDERLGPDPGSPVTLVRGAGYQIEDGSHTRKGILVGPPQAPGAIKTAVIAQEDLDAIIVD